MGPEQTLWPLRHDGLAGQGFACQGFLKGGVRARARPIGPGTFTALHRSILLVSQRVGGGGLDLAIGGR